MVDLFSNKDDPRQVISFVRTITEYHTEEIRTCFLKDVFNIINYNDGSVTINDNRRRIKNPEKLTEKTEKIAEKNESLLRKYFFYFRNKNVKNDLELVNLYPRSQKELKELFEAKTFREIPGAQEEILKLYQEHKQQHNWNYRGELPERYIALCEKEKTSTEHVAPADKYKEIWRIYALYNKTRCGATNCMRDPPEYNHLFADQIFEKIFAIFSWDWWNTFSDWKGASKTIDVLLLNQETIEKQKEYFTTLWQAYDTRKNNIILFFLNMAQKAHLKNGFSKTLFDLLFGTFVALDTKTQETVLQKINEKDLQQFKASLFWWLEKNHLQKEKIVLEKLMLQTWPTQKYCIDQNFFDKLKKYDDEGFILQAIRDYLPQQWERDIKDLKKVLDEYIREKDKVPNDKSIYYTIDSPQQWQKDRIEMLYSLLYPQKRAKIQDWNKQKKHTHE